MAIDKVVDARKVRIDAAAAWEMLRGAEKIIVTRGKKFAEWNSLPHHKDEILTQVMGPSGNLRAPTYRVGDVFVIGFHVDLYEQWLRD